ncbi:hypothetical protein [Mycoplasma suis]|uniref:Uncharacterized protein n=2 Tax=Mycoplasma suis TaxID=57372 RepID=F0QRK9_MYCSL|nr:hypothetical protein [Mycoplasma suis]ADX98129.1 hypothetical protein MSU_0597 [Mycoplasma suis str. Illinois]CBZ40651.1 hypothetical protein MSUIS_05580 [Mycoplasma suis KI3806]
MNLLAKGIISFLVIGLSGGAVVGNYYLNNSSGLSQRTENGGSSSTDSNNHSSQQGTSSQEAKEWCYTKTVRLKGKYFTKKSTTKCFPLEK